MARVVVCAALGVVLTCAIVPVSAATADAATPASASLLGCLELIARTLHVRIVDASGLAASIACVRPEQQRSLEDTLDRLLKPNGLGWRQLDDGTIQIIAAKQTARVDLPALDIEGDPVPDAPRPDQPLATPLVERATAYTALDQRWLDTAPLLGFNQLSWYAPNVYGTGQSLAIRGSERDTDYFPALTVTFDGIELGTRLLDDELVPLDDVIGLDLARGPRTFASGEGAQAGAIALKTAAPAAEPSTGVTAGIGDRGAANGAIAWSGPLASPDLAATVAVDEHVLPSFVRQRAVPAGDVEERHNDFARIKLRYTPDSGLSAQLAALALSGDSSDRQIIVSPARSPGQPAPGPYDPFDRNSYASNPVVARTHARGAAGFVRYDRADRWAIDAHASITTITRDATQWPRNKQWSDYELRRRLGMTASDHPAPDWTIVAGVERDYVATRFATPLPAGQLYFNYFAAATASASIWVEHSWGAWNAGLGLRSAHERATMFADGDRSFGYHVPIPLAIIEWLPAKEHTLTLSYGTGYRSGGQVDAVQTYSPERSRNLELSWRAQWLDGTLHTAVSAFDGEIHDRYTYYLSDLGYPVLASVRNRGLEFELDANLAERWRLRAAVGTLSSRFSASAYRDGDPTSEAPPQTAAFGVRYGGTAGWYAAADAYHAAAAQYYDPAGRLPGYDVLSVRVGFRTNRWETALIAANALDAKYIERIQLSAANETGFRLGDPRRIELIGRLSW